jgi:hypothetical protein
MLFAALHESGFGTNATLGNVRLSAGYEGEADVSSRLPSAAKRTRSSARWILVAFENPKQLLTRLEISFELGMRQTNRRTGEADERSNIFGSC